MSPTQPRIASKQPVEVGTMIRNTPTIFMLAALAIAILAINTPAQAAVILNPSSHDSIRGQSQNTGANPLGYLVDSDEDRIGEQGGSTTRRSQNVVFGFILPTFGAGETLDSATLSFTALSRQGTDQNNAGADPRLDLYLLDTSNPDTTGLDFYYEGPSDPNASVEFIGRYDDDGGSVSFDLTGSALTLLQGFYGGDNTPDQTEAFFRLNLDFQPVLGGSNIERFEIDPASSATSLELTTIPEPASLVMALFGLAVLTARRRR